MTEALLVLYGFIVGALALYLLFAWTMFKGWRR